MCLGLAPNRDVEAAEMGQQINGEKLNWLRVFNNPY